MVNTSYSHVVSNQDISEASAAKRTQAEHMQDRGSSPVLADATPQVSTPYYNMGAQTPITGQTPRKPSPLSSARFDWYQATLPGTVELYQVLRWASFLGAPTPGKPMHGYEKTYDFGQFKVLCGGQSGQYGVHVIIHGGDACQGIVESFRAEFPVHRPSRIDVCLDFQGPGSWDDVYQLGVLTSGRFGVRPTHYGDYLNAEHGRTLYIGSGKSTHKVRLYEKGHEQREKNVNPEAPLDWVRVEFQVRPSAPTRLSAASMTPEQVARSTKWTSFLCDALGAVSAPIVSLTTKKRKPDCVDSFEHMCGQFCNTVHKLNTEGCMTEDDVVQIVRDMYRKGKFKGLPEHVLRNWFF